MQGLKTLLLPISSTINYIQNHFKAMLFLLLLFLIFAPSSKEELTPVNLQKIRLSGPIFTVDSLLDEIHKATKESAIKGVLFEINSPGGAVAPSVEIAYAIKALAQKKPVVVYCSGMLASGGYYSATYATEIIANPGAIVGSIGVIMQGTNMQELFKKVGIASQVVTAGRFKQVGTSERKWLPYERKELEKVIQGTYAMFVNDVAAGRHLDVNHSNEYADAHIFTSAQAKEVGLIDAIGTKEEAKNRLITLSNVKEPSWSTEDKYEQWFKKLSSSSVATLYTYFPSLALY